MKAINTLAELSAAISSALNNAVDHSITISPLTTVRGDKRVKITVDVPFPGKDIDYEVDGNLFAAHKDVFKSVTPGFGEEYHCGISQGVVDELERRDFDEKRIRKLSALID